MSKLFKDGAALLRIYTVEKDQINGMPLYEWLVQKAVAENLSGATVLRGIGGFCSSNPVIIPELHSFEINQPVIVEIIDLEKELERFVLQIDHLIPCGLMTLQPLQTRYYGKRKKNE